MEWHGNPKCVLGYGPDTFCVVPRTGDVWAAA